MDGDPFERLNEFLAPYPDRVRALVWEGREFMHDMLEPVSEIFWDAMSGVCTGFTYTDDVRDNFVNLVAYPSHVTLIFPWGVHLSDPEGRLKGDGKQVRHIRLKGLDTLQDPYVQDLIRQAQANAARPPAPVETTIHLRRHNGVLRRPNR